MTLDVILYIEVMKIINQFTYIFDDSYGRKSITMLRSLTWMEFDHRLSFLVLHMTLHTDESPSQRSGRRPGV